MDVRDSTEYQIWEIKDINVIFGVVLNELKGKRSIVTFLLQKSKRKTWRRGKREENLQEVRYFGF